MQLKEYKNPARVSLKVIHEKLLAVLKEEEKT